MRVIKNVPVDKNVVIFFCRKAEEGRIGKNMHAISLMRKITNFSLVKAVFFIVGETAPKVHPESGKCVSRDGCTPMGMKSSGKLVQFTRNRFKNVESLESPCSWLAVAIFLIPFFFFCFAQTSCALWKTEITALRIRMSREAGTAWWESWCERWVRKPPTSRPLPTHPTHCRTDPYIISSSDWVTSRMAPTLLLRGVWDGGGREDQGYNKRATLRA